MSIFSSLPQRKGFVCPRREPVFVFGAGSFGRAVARACSEKGITVRAFIQTSPQSSNLDGIPVRAWTECSDGEKDLPLLISIFNRDTPFDMLVALANNAGFHRIALPYDIYAQFGGLLGWRYWLSSPELLRGHFNILDDVYETLADCESKDCLDKLVQFRLGLNLSYSSFLHQDAQYFNSISLSRYGSRSISYVDAGAYNGDSFFELRKRHRVSSAYLLEPDPTNFASLAHSVRSAGESAICLPLGIAASHELLRFRGSQGEAGHLDPQGDQGVVTVALDDLLQEQKVDLLKVDIEGSEVNALAGMKRILSQEKPNLAISCYHRPEDIWTLIQLISEYAEYKFYLRQHAFNSFDLVLYAVSE